MPLLPELSAGFTIKGAAKFDTASLYSFSLVTLKNLGIGTLPFCNASLITALLVALSAVSSETPISPNTFATAATVLIGISLAKVITPSMLYFFAHSTTAGISTVLITSLMIPGSEKPIALGFISTATTSSPISFAF